MENPVQPSLVSDESVAFPASISDDETQTGSKRKLSRRAACWKHFNIVKQKGKEIGFCKYCETNYNACSKNGTNVFSRHLEVCEGYKKVKPSDNLSMSKEIDQKVFRRLLADSLMRHGYSFSWVEHEGTRAVFKYLNDNVETLTRNTLQKDCVERYAELKERIRNTLVKLPGRICLTSDLWTACTFRGYMSVTAHYIDENWELHSKLLAFRHCAPPHGGYELSVEIADVMLDWGIESKIFSLTIDNASNMDRMVLNLKGGIFKSLPCKGKYFHVRCAAHILNLIVKKGLKVVGHSISKLRDGIKYIDGSEARKIKFVDLCKRHEIAYSGGLLLDVATRWNSTYLMMDRALKFKDAMNSYFVGMESLAAQYYLCEDEWMKIRRLCGLLEPFYVITTLFSGRDYPTANLYFPQVFMVRSRLKKAMDDGLFDSDDVEAIDATYDFEVDELGRLDLSLAATEMMGMFRKYWDDYVMVLAFAIILDPQYKMFFVEFALTKTHGKEEAETKSKEVYNQLNELFKEYQTIVGVGVPIQAHNLRSDSQMPDLYDNLEEFEIFNPCDRSKTELDRYLDEPRIQIKSGFSVLGFWKENSTNFPVLSSMARDILAIPITSVASESTFSMSGRILNKVRSSLTDENVEALVTTNNWLTGYDDFTDEGIDLDVILNKSLGADKLITFNWNLESCFLLKFTAA